MGEHQIRTAKTDAKNFVAESLASVVDAGEALIVRLKAANARIKKLEKALRLGIKIIEDEYGLAPLALPLKRALAGKGAKDE